MCVQEGTGPEAKPGCSVGMYYVGRLKTNNKQFDSCLTGKPFKFKLGKGEVIKVRTLYLPTFLDNKLVYRYRLEVTVLICGSDSDTHVFCADPGSGSNVLPQRGSGSQIRIRILGFSFKKS